MLPFATPAKLSTDLLLGEIVAGRTQSCLGKHQVFGAVAESFIARWSAVQICKKCPLSGADNVCHKAGKDGKQYGVWGGLYSFDGNRWDVVVPRPLVHITRSLEISIRNKKGPAMINAADRLAPGLKDLIYDEHGESEYQIKGKCIVRPSRRALLPDGTVGSVRQYILTTILCVDIENGNGIIHTSCSTFGCVAPWHLRWSKGSAGLSKGVALALYSGQVKGWSAKNVSHITGISERTILSILKVADKMNPFQIMPDSSTDIIKESLQDLLGMVPTYPEITAMTHICSAADDLDCDTIADLIAAGESEF